MINKLWKRRFKSPIVVLCLFLGFSSFIVNASDGQKKILDSLNMRLSNNIQDSTEKLKVLNALSMSFWKVSPDSSIYYGKRSLHLAESLNNEDNNADSFHNLGVAYFYANSFETSLDYFYQALEIRERKGDPYKVGITLNSIGNIFYALNNVDKALDYYKRSLELIKKSKNMNMEASILINMGSLYASIGEQTKAFELLNQSVDLHEKLNDSLGLSSALNNLAMVYRESGNYVKSLECDSKALKINTQMGKLWEISYISNTIGETYLLMENDKMAFHYFNQALEVAEELDSEDVLLFSYRSMTNYYGATGNLTKFNTFFKKYDELKDRIFATQNTRSIAEMQVKYETEHKEKENALQKLQIAKERGLRNSFIFISILVLIMVIILFLRYRVKKKLNIELESLVKIRTRDLLTNQSKLKEAQRIGRSGSWDWDLINHQINWSDELPIILGMEGKEMNMSSILRATHPEDRPNLYKIFRKEFKHHSNIVFDFRLMSNGKIVKYISLYGEVTRDNEDFPTLIQGTIQDITDRMLVELALRESEELYRKLISASPDAVIETNTKGVIVFASKQSKLLFRVNPTNAITGTSINDWIVESDRLRSSDNIKSLLNGTSLEDVHYVMQRKDGSTFSGEMKTAIIYDTEGIARGLITVIRNITDRKLLEQRILRNTIETEERERVRFSEDLHDGLGPLLSTVKIHLELINARMGNPEEQSKFIKMTDELLQESIKSTREIANNLIPNLLNDFGLIEALSVYVDKINKTNTIRVELNVSELLETLSKHTEVALYRVLCELINNTIKHASASKINISIIKDKKQLEIQYKDNGIGFDVQKMLSSPSKGLGLSNIISRVKSINGSCNFISEPGRYFTSVIRVEISNVSEQEPNQTFK